MFYGFLCAAGIAVINNKGKLVHKTPDEYWSNDADRHAFLKRAGLSLFSGAHGVWEEPETRFILRSFYRNTQRPGSYGVLTGDPTAVEKFFRTGRYILNQGDTVVVYTDGAAELIFKNHLKSSATLKEEVVYLFRNHDFKGLEEYLQLNVKSEGTLAYYAVKKN